MGCGYLRIGCNRSHEDDLRDAVSRVYGCVYVGYYQLNWSDEILDETRRNLVGRGSISEEQAEHLLSKMRGPFPEAVPNDEKDRHVAAAAVKAGAQVVVTSNVLEDFRELPEGIEAQSPDSFLTDLLDLDPAGMGTLLRAQATVLKKPSKTFEQLLEGLANAVPGFVGQIRRHLTDHATAEP